jgi:hypothetical protein
MSGPNTRGMGGVAPKQARTSTAADQRQISIMPSLIPGESTTADGRPAIETETKLSRSPGIFAMRYANDRKSVWIGEDWIGLGNSLDEGGLEGCSEDAPGLVFDVDGNALPVGGSREKTAQALYDEAGSLGNTIVVALIPKATSGITTGIVYWGIAVSDGIGYNLEKWDNLADFVPETYAAYHIVPIAVVHLDEEDDGDIIISDILWNMDQPAVVLGGGGDEEASGTVALLKITGLHPDAPTGVPMLQGDIYGNGSTAAATETGVTVTIPGLAAGVTSPSFGTWNDVPHCCGVSTVRTWTGATETHTDDTVYEAIGLLLVI